MRGFDKIDPDRLYRLMCCLTAAWALGRGLVYRSLPESTAVAMGVGGLAMALAALIMGEKLRGGL